MNRNVPPPSHVPSCLAQKQIAFTLLILNILQQSSPETQQLNVNLLSEIVWQKQFFPFLSNWRKIQELQNIEVNDNFPRI
jgi:hypothetical protein